MGSRPDNEYDVFYVDFGDQEWVTGDRILPAWGSILQLPLQAIECSLVNVQPLGKRQGRMCMAYNRMGIQFSTFTSGLPLSKGCPYRQKKREILFKTKGNEL